MTKQQINPNDIQSRYERARHFTRDFITREVSINSSVIPKWIGSSDDFLYERETRKGKEYRLVSPPKKSNELAFDHMALASALSAASGEEAKPEDLPIDNVEISLSRESLSFSAYGKDWKYDLKKKGCEEVPTNPSHWLVSPDGLRAVFIRDYNLWLIDIESKKETALTTDGELYYAYGAMPESGDIVSGLQSEEHQMLRGIWPAPQALWSPDSSKLFTLQTDERQVLSIPVTAYAPEDGSLRPKSWQPRYPLPGDKHIAEYRMLVIDVEAGSSIGARYPRVLDAGGPLPGPFVYKRAWWASDSNTAYFVDISRYDKDARVVALDTDSGACKVLFEENSDTYLELSLDNESLSSIVPLPETNELIWFSERTGWAHLYLYDLNTGALKRALTEGEWLVRELISVDAERREAFFQAAGRVGDRDPYYREICRVNLDTGVITTLASSDHDYVIEKPGLVGAICGVSPEGNYIVSTRARVDQLSVSELRDRDGVQIMTLETASIEVPENWPWPEPVKLVAADGKTDIYGVVLRPSNFDPNKKYPVIDFAQALSVSMFVPKGSFTTDGVSFGGVLATAWAELGFIVVMIDGRGSAMKGKAFNSESFGKLHTASNLEDHIAGIRQLAERYPYMDLDRIGITHTGGCNSPVYGLLAFPDFYKVGVACSVLDTRLLVGSEAYQGAPHEKNYFPLNLGDLADNLEGRLLIIQGMMDNFYQAAGAFQLMEALIQKNKNFDSLMMPNGPHMFRNGYAMRRGWDYMVEHLLGETPPSNFVLKSFLEQ